MCTKDQACIIHVMARLSDELGAPVTVRDRRPLAEVQIDTLRIDLVLIEEDGRYYPRLNIRTEAAENMTAPRVAVMAELLGEYTKRVTFVQGLIDSHPEWNWPTAELDKLINDFESWRAEQDGVSSLLGAVLGRSVAAAGEA